MRNRSILVICLTSLLLLFSLEQREIIRAQDPDDIIVEDIFGKIVNESGITLVDWDGYIANPAIKVFIKPPAGVRFPATAVLTSPEPRAYFDLPSDVGPNGPRKSITFNDASKVPVYISIFPDRDGDDEDHPLTIQLTDANGLQKATTINLHVIDQDKNQPLVFNITVDFSKDQTGFFNDPQKRDIIRQAADDWAYFIDDMKLDAVPAGAETTFIWNPDGFVSGSNTTNTSAYKGFLLYVYGIHSPALRSGGGGSYNGGFQSSNGSNLPLRRSGGVAIETQGNFNTLGWFLTTGDDDWWKASNLGDEQNDLYSIAHHEIGHALFFNSAYPIFAQSKAKGFIEDAELLAYHGSYPRIDNSDHFNGEIDDASKKGVFGYEYFGDVPRRRWLITKLDILSVQAIGYKIRRTFALSVLDTNLPSGILSSPYSATLQAKGGIPPYSWAVESGAMPDGLTLKGDTGVISGVPSSLLARPERFLRTHSPPMWQT